jgi:hypothetical protein
VKGNLKVVARERDSRQNRFAGAEIPRVHKVER